MVAIFVLDIGIMYSDLPNTTPGTPRLFQGQFLKIICGDQRIPFQ